MIDKILTWIITKILEYLFGKVETELKSASQDMAKEKEREQVNEKNIIKYEAAKSRAEKIKAAKNLLNGTSNDAG